MCVFNELTYAKQCPQYNKWTINVWHYVLMINDNGDQEHFNYSISHWALGHLFIRLLAKILYFLNSILFPLLICSLIIRCLSSSNIFRKDLCAVNLFESWYL